MAELRGHRAQLRKTLAAFWVQIGRKHALMDGSLPITRVHDRTVELEALFKKTFPTIHKVTIHTEPESERGVVGRRQRLGVGGLSERET